MCLCVGDTFGRVGGVSVGGECRAVARVSLCVCLSVGQFWERIVVCVSGFGGGLWCVFVWDLQVSGVFRLGVFAVSWCERENTGVFGGRGKDGFCVRARIRAGGGCPVCVCVSVCGPVTAGSGPGHINFAPLRAGSGGPAVAASGNGKQMGRDGGHMGLGAGAHSSLPEPPGSPLPVGPPSGRELELTQ